MTDLAPLHDSLIAWFEANKEDLPWRRNRDPYAIWLSEIMLQQTQVGTVISYYERFLSRFPDVHALAAASLDDVLKVWEGLGYYSRARNLHRAARMVVAESDGIFPSTVDGLLRLPGVGRYTAGAVASLAFGEDVPILDGNVTRVLTRLFNLIDDIAQAQTKQALWNLAGRSIPAGRAGPWNEGLMELGRRVCTPRAPHCEDCPLAGQCRARQLGLQEARPVRQQRTQTPHFDVTAGVIRRADGQILIAQRPKEGMLGGLWEFPGGKRQLGESLSECLVREIREELGVEIGVGDQIASIRHAYTHFHITLFAFECFYVNGTPRAIECANWAWVRPEEFDRYAFPVTDQKIIATLRNGG